MKHSQAHVRGACPTTIKGCVIRAFTLLLLDEESVSEVIDRCRALYGVLAVVEGVSASEVGAFLSASGLDRALSSGEREYLGAVLDSPPEAHELELQLSWRTECMYALGWALGLIEDLEVTGTAGNIAEQLVPGAIWERRQALG